MKRTFNKPQQQRGDNRPPQFDRDITVRLHKGRLAIWPGNVSRWVEPDESGEVSVTKAPIVGAVPAIRLENGAASRAIKEIEQSPRIKHFATRLFEGWTVVIPRIEVPGLLAACPRGWV